GPQGGLPHGQKLWEAVSVVGPGCARIGRARCPPLLIGLELHADLVIEDFEVPLPVSRHRLRHNRAHFLRDHADIGLLAAVVDKTIEAETVLESAKKFDVMLEPDIGAPAATPAARACRVRACTAGRTATHVTTARAAGMSSGSLTAGALLRSGVAGSPVRFPRLPGLSRPVSLPSFLFLVS